MFRCVLAFSICLMVTACGNGDCGGGQYSGMATYFSNSKYGACGQPIYGQTQIACGISGEWFNNVALPANDPRCYQQTANCAQVSYDGRMILVPVMDMCNCANKTDIYLSQAAFEQLAPIKLGVIPIQWSFVSVPLSSQPQVVYQAPPPPVYVPPPPPPPVYVQPPAPQSPFYVPPPPSASPVDITIPITIVERSY